MAPLIPLMPIVVWLSLSLVIAMWVVSLPPYHRYHDHILNALKASIVCLFGLFVAIAIFELVFGG